MINQDEVTNWSAGQVERHNTERKEYIDSVMREKGHYGRFKDKPGGLTVPKNSDRFNAKPIDKIYRMKP